MRLLITAFTLSAVAAGPVFGQAIQTRQERPSIIVDGYGEVKTSPDVATIGYTLRGEGQTSDDAVRAMVAMGARIEAELRSVDPAAAPRTDRVQVTPVKPGDCKESRYVGDGSPQLSTGSCAIVGYVATQGVTIRTADVKDAGTMVGLAGRGGAYYAQINGFELRDPKPAKRQAAIIALADAQSKAEALAAGSHVALGPILRISPGGGVLDVISAEDIGRFPDRVVPAPPPPPPVPVTLTPEPITTRANVLVSYAIGS